MGGVTGYFPHAGSVSGSRPATPDLDREKDTGHYADSEDDHLGSKKSKGKQRNSGLWMTHSSPSLSAPGMPRQVSGSSTVTQDTLHGASAKLTGHGIASPGVAPSPVGTPSGLHVYPPTTTANSPDTMLAPPFHRPGTPASVNGGGGNAQGDDEAVVMQAAKVLKTALLHDARNLTGNVDENITGLGWNVNSAHEAKVSTQTLFLRP